MENNRQGGVLMHITSLPNSYGIGTLGSEAYRFVDFLISSGQKIWQVLPLGPTGYGDSPYQCLSTFAGNHLLISLEKLIDDELLSKEEIEMKPDFSASKLDYEAVRAYKEPLLRLAFKRFKRSGSKFDYISFCRDNEWWLGKYSEFMALREFFDNKAWYEWRRDGKELEREDVLENIEYHHFLQFIFFVQWYSLKSYANARGVKIIGDLPIYVASDSADTYSNKTLFMSDGKGRPTFVAGVPPDYFSETGQLWGNSLYRWGAHKSSRFRWWIKRISFSVRMYDYVRIDHFRGLCGFWAVPAGEETAVNGEWKKAEGRALLRELSYYLPEMPIIAEDLGVITEEVVKLRDDYGISGMKILQFAFDGNEQSDFAIYNYKSNCVAYSGTHDNDTLKGWLNKLDENTRIRIIEYVGREDDLIWSLLRVLWSSVADRVIIPMQDLLELDSWARMNTPSTAVDNWNWRAENGYDKEELIIKLRRTMCIFGRL